MHIEETPRRQQHGLAEQVDWAITLLETAGLCETHRYMVGVGVPIHVMERVSTFSAYYRCAEFAQECELESVSNAHGIVSGT